MSQTLHIGDIELTFVSGGALRIDGGNMFGVVPRLLWEKASPPDELHRIRLDTNCVVVRTPNSLGLIDTGYGGKAPPKVRQRNALEGGEPLVRNLAAVGVEPAAIDWVALTHLHFDHAGGLTRLNDAGELEPAFSRARHFIQRREWDDATGNHAELAGAYSTDDIAPLETAGLVQLLDGDAEISPGVRVQLTGGHTRGHQLVRIGFADASAVVLGDMCPTAAHLPKMWTLAYDQFPLDVRRMKPVLLDDIADVRRIALFSHDPQILAAHLTRAGEGNWTASAICTRT